MADFCGPCEDDMFGARTKYTKHTIEFFQDEIVKVKAISLLCEGCGVDVIVDMDGNLMRKEGRCAGCDEIYMLRNDGTCGQECADHMNDLFLQSDNDRHLEV